MDHRSHLCHTGSPTEHEDELRRRVSSSQERHLAEAASSVLAVVLERFGDVLTADQRLDGNAIDQSARRLIAGAILAASARTFRTVRAGIAVVSSGYEPEADAMTRVLLELYVSARAILDDPTGEEARARTSRPAPGVRRPEPLPGTALPALLPIRPSFLTSTCTSSPGWRPS
jgi:hypothetical protein